MKTRPIILALLLALATTWLFADELPIPGASWTYLDASGGWDAGKLDDLQGRLRHTRPTALLILQGDRTVASWGETGRKVNVYSVRKSILSALYGIGVADGRIRLDRTLEELGIEDREPKLTQDEKQATIRDLLKARSGIYRVAAFELGDMAKDRPARGSHPHGTFWSYNNFDFNTLGTIYTRVTGEGVFEAVERRLAAPLGMLDFTAADGENVFDPRSDHPAYLMRFTARDLARFGLLYLQNGRWNGRQLVPEEWIRESTTAYSVSGAGLGYGYLWWRPPPDFDRDDMFFAMGWGGQIVAIAPSRRLVVVQTVDVRPNQGGLASKHLLDVLKLILAAAPKAQS